MAGRSGRPFPTHTPLGQMMAEDGLTVHDVVLQTGIHHRTMTEYLAGRKPMTLRHLALLARLLDCEPDMLEYKEEEAGQVSVLLIVLIVLILLFGGLGFAIEGARLLLLLAFLLILVAMFSYNRF